MRREEHEKRKQLLKERADRVAARKLKEKVRGHDVELMRRANERARMGAAANARRGLGKQPKQGQRCGGEEGSKD